MLTCIAASGGGRGGGANVKEVLQPEKPHFHDVRHSPARTPRSMLWKWKFSRTRFPLLGFPEDSDVGTGRMLGTSILPESPSTLTTTALGGFWVPRFAYSSTTMHRHDAIWHVERWSERKPLYFLLMRSYICCSITVKGAASMRHRD